jgi:predicted secreted hydrolase
VKVLALLTFALVPFAVAKAPYHFRFPRDHGAHFSYQSEWWYFTGHLQAADGRRFGYELTIFRFGLHPGELQPRKGESRWHTSEIYPAHFAITDVARHVFVSYERFERGALGMASARKETLDVHSGDWSIEGTNPIRIVASRDDDALHLALKPQKPPSINSAGGVSRKGSCASCASHYYSMTRLATSGIVESGGVRYRVGGLSWMDHEFGSDELQPDQSGWDWFALQLDDDREIMLYRLRQKDGGTTPQSSGSLVERNGAVRHLRISDFQTQALGSWKSPHTGAVYPSGWRVRVPSEGIDVTVTPVMRDQELVDRQLGVAYWEGDCNVRGVDEHRPVRGVAYVELTGYAGTLHL